jgi:hypothetical protein
MDRVRSPGLVLLLVAIAATGLTGDELHLRDGRVIEGEIISGADAEVIDVRVGSGGLVAIQHIPRAQVERIVHRVSARQHAQDDLARQVAALERRQDASAADWWMLAERHVQRGETATARDLAQRVLALDRHHGEARKLLGMVRHRGVWMRANEAATAKGEVFFRGAWVTWAAQEQALADEARRREEQLAMRKEREELRRQARLAALAAAETSAALRETTYYAGSYYRSPYYNPFGGWYYQGTHPACPPRPHHHGGGSGWHLGVSGGGSSSAWSFRWGGSGSSWGF